jgi:two-component system chemotaxis sensor kinase CheA
VESLQPKSEALEFVNGKERVVKVHDQFIPILPLHKLFNIETKITAPEEGILVLLRTDDGMIALLIDALIGQQQVVLKSIEQNYRKVPCVSGATIMGNGKVALILDSVGLVNHFQKQEIK